MDWYKYQNLAAMIAVRNHLNDIISNTRLVSRDKYSALSKLVKEMDTKFIDEIMNPDEADIPDEEIAWSSALEGMKEDVVQDEQLELNFNPGANTLYGIPMKEEKKAKKKVSSEVPSEIAEKVAEAKKKLGDMANRKKQPIEKISDE